MSTLYTELHDALLAAKVPDEQARAAASAFPPADKLVMKDDLQEFPTKEDLKRLDAKLEAGLKANQAGLKENRTEIKDCRGDLNRLDAKLEAGLKDFRDDLNRLETKLGAEMATRAGLDQLETKLERERARSDLKMLWGLSSMTGLILMTLGICTTLIIG